MSAPTRALPGPTVRRPSRRPRLDPLFLLWALMPLEVICGCLTSAIGAWALAPAGGSVIVVVALAVWAAGGES